MRFKLILRRSEILPAPRLLGARRVNGGCSSSSPAQIETHVVFLATAVADGKMEQSGGKRQSERNTPCTPFWGLRCAARGLNLALAVTWRLRAAPQTRWRSVHYHRAPPVCTSRMASSAGAAEVAFVLGMTARLKNSSSALALSPQPPPFLRQQQ